MSFRDVIPVILPELVLIVAACVLFLLGISNKPAIRRLVPMLALLALLAVAAYQGLPTFRDALGFQPNAENIYADPIGAFRVGGFAEYIKLLAACIGAMFVLLAWPTNEQGTGNSALQYGTDAAGEFFALLLLSVAGIFLVAGANDLIVLFLGIELASIPTYIMVSISRPLPVAQEAGVKYFFLGAMAAAILLFGFSYLYGTTGLINLRDLTALFGGTIGTGASVLTSWQMLAAVMLIAGLCFKIAAVPLHFYAGDVYEGAATPVTALLSFVPKTSGFVALIKILFVISGGAWMVPAPLGKLLWVLAALTMTFGNVLGLMQQNVKRVLAYSSIAHTGYMLVGLTVLVTTPDQKALEGIVFYLTAYGIMNVAAFGVLLMLPSRTPQAATSAETYDDLAGTGRDNVGLGLAMAVACLSLIGIPLTMGFWGKAFLLLPTFHNHHTALGIIMLINAAIGAAYYLRIVGVMFLRPAAPVSGPAVAAPVRATPIMLAIVFSTLATLGFGIIVPATQYLRLQLNGIAVDQRPTLPPAAASISP
jgi:NADH-quinone oxidoreductase subunit N